MPEKKLTAAIYVRVSTEEQKHDLQFQELRQYARRMGWKVIEYAEKMSSIKTRPLLNQLFRDARLHKFDVLLVWKLDRFARSLRELIANIQRLDSYDVRFICVTQGIDTDKRNPMATLIMHIMGAFAEFERAIIVERVRAGVAEAARQGRPNGRRPRIFRRDKAVAMRKRGMSFRAIAKKLDVPLTTVVHAIKGKNTMLLKLGRGLAIAAGETYRNGKVYQNSIENSSSKHAIPKELDGAKKRTIV